MVLVENQRPSCHLKNNLMNDNDQQSVGRSLPISIGVGLLIVAGSLFFLRKCGEPENISGLGDGALFPEKPAMVSSASSSGNLTRKQASAKVRSLLAVEEGEVAVIGLPAGALEQYFQFNEPDDIEKAKPGIVRGLQIENHGRDQLEAILMDGGELSGNVREVGKHVTFSNVGMRVAVSPGRGQNLDLIIGDEGGQIRLKCSIPAGTSGETILRSAYPNPKAVMIVLRRDQIKDGD